MSDETPRPGNATPGRRVVLSLVLGSRNDEYMGNSRWRLQTALNYVAKRAEALGRTEEVEVLVTDWGSEVPLQEALRLSPAAARMVSILPVPREIALELQQDSPFPEVLTVNAAARRANGQYIGRIDQDTLVGSRFLETFFDLHEGRRILDVPLPTALMFANQRMVPYRFSVRCPSPWAVEQYIGRFGRQLKVEVTARRPFYKHGVGIWLIHRNLWNECGGYDERMIYANFQEVNMIARLMSKYEMVDLGKLVDYDFYHIEHYHSLEPRHSARYRRVNPGDRFARPERMHPNGKDWGLAQYPFRALPYAGNIDGAADLKRPFDTARYLLLLLTVGVLYAFDRVILKFLRAAQASIAFLALWKHRAGVARRTIDAQPISAWPRLLMTRWKQRKPLP